MLEIKNVEFKKKEGYNPNDYTTDVELLERLGLTDSIKKGKRIYRGGSVTTGNVGPKKYTIVLENGIEIRRTQTTIDRGNNCHSVNYYVNGTKTTLEKLIIKLKGDLQMLETIKRMRELESKIKEMSEKVNIKTGSINFQNGKTHINKEKREVIKFKSSRHADVIDANDYKSSVKDKAYKLSGYIISDNEIFCSIEKLEEHPIEKELTVQTTYYVELEGNNISVQKI